MLLISPPEPQIVSRNARDGHVKWAAVRALVCMQCRLHLDNHSPWSPLNCQKTGAALEPKILQGPPPLQRSIGSICIRASLSAVKRRPVHLAPQRRQSWTLAAQSLPYLQAPRRRTRFGTRLVVEVRTSWTAKAALLAHQTYQALGYNDNIINIEKSTASLEIYYVQAYRFSQVRRWHFTKQQRPVRSSHPC
jgi:hypothetical protein